MPTGLADVFVMMEARCCVRRKRAAAGGKPARECGQMLRGQPETLGP
jgi:hypothetical protein